MLLAVEAEGERLVQMLAEEVPVVPTLAHTIFPYQVQLR
jgi:hypothetical protein